MSSHRGSVAWVGVRNFPMAVFFKNLESYLTAIIDMPLQRSGIVDITMLYRLKYEHPSQIVGFIRLGHFCEISCHFVYVWLGQPSDARD